MKITDQMVGTGSAQLSKCYGGTECSQGDGVEHMLHAVLDELLPPPGTNPLAHDLAPHRASAELSWIRQVLNTVDGAEARVRERMTLERRRSSAGLLGQMDSEAEQILTTLTTIRRALTPWAMSGWISMNIGHDTETEQG